jgi:hypothetical protein
LCAFASTGDTDPEEVRKQILLVINKLLVAVAWSGSAVYDKQASKVLEAELLASGFIARLISSINTAASAEPPVDGGGQQPKLPVTLSNMFTTLINLSDTVVHNDRLRDMGLITALCRLEAHTGNELRSDIAFILYNLSRAELIVVSNPPQISLQSVSCAAPPMLCVIVVQTPTMRMHIQTFPPAMHNPYHVVCRD